MAFEYTPDDLTTSPVVTGNVTIEIPGDTYGGDVGSRVTSDFEWSIEGAPTRTYPTGAAADAEVEGVELATANA